MKTVQFQYFPKNKRISSDLKEIVDVFAGKYDLICSPTNDLDSNAVLGVVKDGLIELGFNIEKSKKREDKIQIPVLFGKNGSRRRDCPRNFDRLWTPCKRRA